MINFVRVGVEGLMHKSSTRILTTFLTEGGDGDPALSDSEIHAITLAN